VFSIHRVFKRTYRVSMIPVIVLSFCMVLARPATAASLVPGDPLADGFVIGSAGSNSVEPRVARAADGTFVIVFENGGGGDMAGIHARRFKSDATPAGDAFRVNTTTEGSQAYPQIAMAPTGEFVIVWHSADVDFTSFDAFAQRFDAQGNPVGGEISVPRNGIEEQWLPVVAMNPDGAFVVAWDGQYGVFLQRYLSDGNPADGVITVDTADHVAQDPAIAMNPDGSFVVAWGDQDQDGDQDGVLVRKYAADGTESGSAIRVNTTITGVQRRPAVATAVDGSFLVVWDAWDGDGWIDVQGQFFDADGTRVGEEFTVNDVIRSHQSTAQVAAMPLGGYVVTWTGYQTDTEGVYARSFYEDGEAMTDDISISVGSGQQDFSATGTDVNGNFVVVWNDEGSINGSLRAGHGSQLEIIGESSDHQVGVSDKTDLIVYVQNDPVDVTGISAYDELAGVFDDVIVELQPDDGTVIESAAGENWSCTITETVTTCLYDGSFSPGDFSEIEATVSFKTAGMREVGLEIYSPSTGQPYGSNFIYTMFEVSGPGEGDSGGGGGGVFHWGLLALLPLGFRKRRM